MRRSIRIASSDTSKGRAAGEPPRHLSPAPEERATVGERCWRCGSESVAIHCKIVCPNCGFRRDCSDP